MGFQSKRRSRTHATSGELYSWVGYINSCRWRNEIWAWEGGESNSSSLFSSFSSCLTSWLIVSRGIIALFHAASEAFLFIAAYLRMFTRSGCKHIVIRQCHFFVNTLGPTERNNRAPLTELFRWLGRIRVNIYMNPHHKQIVIGRRLPNVTLPIKKKTLGEIKEQGKA